jgi:hypothetical protein
MMNILFTVKTCGVTIIKRIGSTLNTTPDLTLNEINFRFSLTRTVIKIGG